MTTLDLTIDDIGAQGDGVAHHGNETIFVAGALTGERVRVSLEDTANKNVVKRGTLLEVLIPCSLRAKPPCPHFPQCGGCRFQHMNDAAYSKHKVAQLQQTLAQAKVPAPPFMPAVVTAAQTRRRARFAAKRDKTGMHIGFNEWRSHAIVDVTACSVIRPELADLLAHLREHLPVWLPVGESCDIQATVLPDGIDVVLIGGPKLEMIERQNLGELARLLKVAHLSWRKWDRSPIEPIAHAHPLSVTFSGTRVPFPPSAFLQATEAGESALINFACTNDRPKARVLDLFCGLGGFGLSFENAASVCFSDIDGPSVEALSREAKKNPRYKVMLRNLILDPFSSEELNAFDLVVFDPPRGGAKAQSEHLAKSKVPEVIAVSCDPPSFARDAKILIAGGYTLERLLPVDQFLWSAHMELAARFVR